MSKIVSKYESITLKCIRINQRVCFMLDGNSRNKEDTQITKTI